MESGHPMANPCDQAFSQSSWNPKCSQVKNPDNIKDIAKDMISEVIIPIFFCEFMIVVSPCQ